MLADTKLWPWRAGPSSEGLVLALMKQKIRYNAHTPRGVQAQAHTESLLPPFHGLHLPHHLCQALGSLTKLFWGYRAFQDRCVCRGEGKKDGKGNVLTSPRSFFSAAPESS